MIIREGKVAVVRSAANWLSLAAAPVFAVMALLTAARGGPADFVCVAAHGSSPLENMTLMYALMSVFHAAPWLKLISNQRGAPES